MTTGVTTFRENRPVEIPVIDGLLVMAILVAGGAAAYVAMPVLWIATPIMAVFVRYSARRTTSVAMGTSDAAESEFPPAVQHSIDAAVDQLRPGEARKLLANVLRQARPLFAARESSFDAEMERETREDISELVSAACETALELSRLDGAAPVHTANGATNDERLDVRYQRARQTLVTRLCAAAAALSEMYASGVEHGTPASDRVAELAQELRLDARARLAAKAEVDSVIASDDTLPR